MQRSLKDFGFLTLGQVFGLLMGFIVTVFLARLLGPEKYGIYNLLISITSSVAAFLSFGLSFSSFYYASRKERLLGTSVCFSTLVSSLGILALWLTSPYLETTYEIPNLSLLVKLFSFEVLFLNLFNVFVGFFKGLGRFSESALLNILFNALRLLIVFFVLLGFGLMGAIVGRMVDWLLVMALGMFFGKDFLELALDSEMLKEILYYSLPLYLFSIFSFFTSQVFVIVLGLYGGTLVGYYSAAFKVASLISMLTIPISDVGLQRMIGIKDGKLVSKITQKITKYSSYLGAFLLVNIVTFSSEIVNIVYSEEYIPASIPLIILAVAFYISSSFRAYNSYFLGRKKTRVVMVVGILQSMIALLSCYFLISAFGVVGASLSYLVSVMVAVISYALISKVKKYEVEVGRDYLIKATLAGGLTGITGKLISLLLPTTLSIFIVPIFSLVLMLLVLYFLNGLDEEDYEVISQVIKRIIS
ncbi:MAG: flippase [Nanoarchaeota archaeon]|nr:flippase [Nanoarchaeota archaeon]